MSHRRHQPYAPAMSWLRRWWALTGPTAMPAASASPHPDRVAPRTARDWSVDVAAFVISIAVGAFILSITVDNDSYQMTSGHVATDVALGAVCCLSLWWRRRWPFGVALVCVLFGAFTTFGSVAGLLALASLAVHRHVRPALLVAALYVPAAVVCSIWLGRPNPWSVMLPAAALAAAATGWGMFVRARVSFFPACATVPNVRRPTSSFALKVRAWRSGPASRGRCTTCSPTASPWWRCTLGPSRSHLICLPPRCGRQ